MIRRLSLILSIILLSASAWAYTETFYLCQGGDGTLPETNACATAYDIDDINTSGNWDATPSVTDDGKIGPDDLVEVMDDGGVFRQQITIQESGLSGYPITFKNQSGDTPVIRLTTAVSGWVKDFDGDTSDVYRATAPNTYSFGTMNEAQTDRLGHYQSKPAWGSWTDGYSSGRDNNSYVYIRDTDEDPDAWDSPPEVGTRKFGIYMTDKSYITIDGIHIYGPEGATTNVGAKLRGGIHIEGDGDFVAVKNCVLVAFGGVGINFRSFDASASNGTVEDTSIHGAWGGIWLDTGGSTWTVSRVHITNTAMAEKDTGDRDMIGCHDSEDVIVQDSYLYMQGHDDAATDFDNAGIVSSGCNGLIVRRNFISQTGYNGVTAGNLTDGETYEVQIYNNVFADWGRKAADPSPAIDDHSAIRIKASIDTDVFIYNNVFINGPTQSINSTVYLNLPGFDSADTIHLKNNLFHNNTGLGYELYWSVGSAATRSITNNYFYRTSGGAVYHDGLSPTDYDYNELASWEAAVDAQSTGYAVDNINQDDGTLTDAAGDNPNINPTSFILTASTPAIVKTGGLDLSDADYDLALHPERVWTPFALMDLQTVGRGSTYSIGPFEYMEDLSTITTIRGVSIN